MRHPFQEALEEVGESDTLDTADEAPAPVLIGGLATSFASHSGLATGSHCLWERAADWVPEAEAQIEATPAPPLPKPPPPPAPSVEPAAIAEELGLSKLSTFDDLNRARRKFMWENHPDRRDDVSREIAHRRVATANMLLDRAYAYIERRKRKV